MNSRVRVTGAAALLLSPVLLTLPKFATTALAQHDHATPEAGGAWERLGLPEITLTVTADAVEGVPESLPAGRYLLHLSGSGPVDPEQGAAGAMFLQLPEGMTLDQAMTEAAGAQNGPPAFYYDALLPGGVSLTYDGSTSAVSIIDLTPGDWLVAGSHFSQPPVQFTVTGEMPAALPEPESTATITLHEMTITLTSGSLTTGTNLVKLENTGEQPHFLDLQKAPDGTTAEQVEATLMVDMGGTPSADALDLSKIIPISSSPDISGGSTMWYPITVAEPGTYVGLCFISDPESGMPHAMMGMYTIFTIE
jgi:hypothetical protein